MERITMITWNKTNLQSVEKQQMKEIYEKLKTPFKYGPVIKLEDAFTDSPSVFFWKGQYYMYFISISKDCNISGYETHLAVSNDLIHWNILGTVLKRGTDNSWDSSQVAGYASFIPITYGETPEIKSVKGHFYIPYLGGNQDGYEPDPLSTGLVICDNPVDASTWRKLERPILTPNDVDCRPGEEKTIYKCFMFEDPAQITGYPYVNVYNAKDSTNRERIFMAVSNDGKNWERFGDGPILDQITDDPDGLICGDPQIIKIGDIYVMLYFRCRKGGKAYNTFACSFDLINWTPWDGKPLIEPEYEWEDIHAHKTWFIREHGVNYHFYCAVNHQNERFIALAVSKDFS